MSAIQHFTTLREVLGLSTEQIKSGLKQANEEHGQKALEKREAMRKERLFTVAMKMREYDINPGQRIFIDGKEYEVSGLFDVDYCYPSAFEVLKDGRVGARKKSIFNKP